MEDLFKLYQKLKSLTKAESEIIEKGDYQSLQEKLSKKKRINR